MSSIAGSIFGPIAAPIAAGVNSMPWAGGYVESIYQGLKDVDGEENLATGVTGVRVSNATGSGTVTVSVDGVALSPAFATANEIERFWKVSGTEVSWAMSGVTSFELGQGKA